MDMEKLAAEAAVAAVKELTTSGVKAGVAVGGKLWAWIRGKAPEADAATIAAVEAAPEKAVGIRQGHRRAQGPARRQSATPGRTRGAAERGRRTRGGLQTATAQGDGNTRPRSPATTTRRRSSDEDRPGTERATAAASLWRPPPGLVPGYTRREAKGMQQTAHADGHGNVIVQIVGEGNAVTVGGATALRLASYEAYAAAPADPSKAGEPGWTASGRRETRILYPLQPGRACRCRAARSCSRGCRAWLAGPWPVSVQALIGGGGRGKTRLAVEAGGLGAGAGLDRRLRPARRPRRVPEHRLPDDVGGALPRRRRLCRGQGRRDRRLAAQPRGPCGRSSRSDRPCACCCSSGPAARASAWWRDALRPVRARGRGRRRRCSRAVRR